MSVDLLVGFFVVFFGVFFKDLPVVLVFWLGCGLEVFCLLVRCVLIICVCVLV